MAPSVHEEAVEPSNDILGILIVNQWEFQDPKMEVLYHFSGHILRGYPPT